MATAGLAATPLLALYAAQQGRAGSGGVKKIANVDIDPGSPSPLVFQTYSQADYAASEKVETDVLVGLVCEEGEPMQTSAPGTADSACVCEEGAKKAEVAGRRAGVSKAASTRRTPKADAVEGAADGPPGGRALLALARKDRMTRMRQRTHKGLLASGESPLHLEARDVFRVDDRREFLRDLPLAVAEPPPHLAEILEGWGVRTLGGFTALSKADVTQRLGTEGLMLWERAAGEVTRPLRMITPPQTFTAEMTLEHEIETLEPLLFVLRRFIDRLALELRNAGFVAGEMTLGLMLADDTAHTRAFRLPEPTAREEILFRVLHTHLESLHTAETVRGVSLECRPVRPLARQQGLFESALRDPHGFAETLGRVAAVVGPERVGTPVLENTHRPDAVQLVVPATVVPPMAKAEMHPARGLPLRRYREPLMATVELSGAAPAYVWTRSMQGAVHGLGGPWRGSGEWWDAGRLWRREEWDVELESGGVYRLLRKPEGWFVEGEYD
jgi:hypothetical protein